MHHIKIVTAAFVIFLILGCSSNSDNNSSPDNEKPLSSSSAQNDSSSTSAASSEELSSTSSSSVASATSSLSSESSSSLSSSATSASPSNQDLTQQNTATLSGADTAQLGETLDFSHIIYRDVEQFGPEVVILTNNAEYMDFNRLARGEIEQSDIIIRPSEGLLYSLNIQAEAIALEISTGPHRLSYYHLCEGSAQSLENCAGVSFNQQARTLSLSNIEMTLNSTGVTSETPLFLSGEFSWREFDQTVSQESFTGQLDDIAGSPAGVDLAFLQGVWEGIATETGSDQEASHAVFDGNSMIEFEYTGDASIGGANCYITNENRIEELGGGVFNMTGTFEDSPTFQVLIEKVSENEVILRLWNNSSGATRSSLSVSDFVPECEEDEFDLLTDF